MSTHLEKFSKDGAAKPKKRIMSEFVINEISCVDIPAQEGARVMFVKNAVDAWRIYASGALQRGTLDDGTVITKELREQIISHLGEMRMVPGLGEVLFDRRKDAAEEDDEVTLVKREEPAEEFNPELNPPESSPTWKARQAELISWVNARMEEQLDEIRAIQYEYRETEKVNDMNTDLMTIAREIASTEGLTMTSALIKARQRSPDAYRRYNEDGVRKVAATRERIAKQSAAPAAVSDATATLGEKAAALRKANPKLTFTQSWEMARRQNADVAQKAHGERGDVIGKPDWR